MTRRRGSLSASRGWGVGDVATCLLSLESGVASCKAFSNLDELGRASRLALAESMALAHLAASASFVAPRATIGEVRCNRVGLGDVDS